MFVHRILTATVGWLALLPLLAMKLNLDTAQSVIVSWDANSESDLAGYRVYWGDRSGRYQEDVYVGNVTSHRISDLRPDRRYYFAVTAVDHAGNESAFSDEVNITLPPDDDPPDDDDQPQEPSDTSVILSTLVYNFPNPFQVTRETTAIRYELFESAELTIQILDANTNLVKTIIKNQFKREGEHTEDRWDGTNRHGDYVSNGVYFCSIRTKNEQRMIKIALRR